MLWSYDFRIKCVELYRAGKWPDVPDDVNLEQLKSNIRRWSELMELHGEDILRDNKPYRFWTPEEKCELALKVISGASRRSVAIEAGISGGLLYRWVQKYKAEGYNGLVQKTGRPCKEDSMKKKINSKPLNETEREELIRLREENEYIKTENEVIKKLIALRHEKWAAELKAKEQQSSKSSGKKDTN